MGSCSAFLSFLHIKRVASKLILCYGWKGNNIQPMSKDVQAEMLDRLKDTEVRV